MLKTPVLLVLMFPALICSAAEYGVGVSTKEALLFPVRVTESVTLEPQIAWVTQRDEFGGGWSRYRGLGLGIGAFVSLAKTPVTQTYVGLRVMRNKTRVTQDAGGSGNSTTESVSPVLGLQYALTPNLAIAGELGYGFRRSKLQNVSPGFGTSSSKSSGQGTETQIVVRYYFGK
jgi:hypothetical protein